MHKSQILLTNDDGIDSPGLWAAADSLSDLGYVSVVAPRNQSSGMGRSMPPTSDGLIRKQDLRVKGQTWQVYAVGGTPAQAVLHGVIEILAKPPDLVVSGINYGQNLGSGITISGTVGAALEAAALGIPSLAVSLETEDKYHLTHSRDIDFSTAALFTAHFGRLLLNHPMPPDVDVLKVDIPSDATEETPWEITRVSRLRYFSILAPERQSWETPGQVGYKKPSDPGMFEPDSDAYAVDVNRVISVTPLSLDLTSRVALGDLEKLLREGTL